MNFVFILTTSAVLCSGQLMEKEVRGQHNINRTNVKVMSYNSTGDYDYEELEAKDVRELTFLDKWRELYEQGKTVPVNKHIKHINETFNSLKVFQQNMEYLFMSQGNSREQQKLLEFLSEIDLGLSNGCLSSLTHVIQGIGKKELWALKCE